MEISPPYNNGVKQSTITVSENRKGTYNSIVLAADSLGAACTTGANTNDADRGALETNQCIDVLKYNAQAVKNISGGR